MENTGQIEEKGWEALLGRAGIVRWKIDERGTVLGLHGPVKKLLGYEVEELVGRVSVWELAAEGDRAGFRSRVEGRMESGEAFSRQMVELKKRDGAVLYLQVSGEPVWKQDRMLAGYEGMAVECGDEVRTARALQGSEGRWREYVMAAPYGIFIADPKGYYREVNEAACRLTGYEREALQGMNVQDLLDEETLPRAAAHFARVQREGAASGTFRLRKADGSGFWCSVVASRLPWGDLVGFVEDITPKRKVEAYQRQLLTAFEQARDGIAITRLDGKVLYVNHSWASQHGMTVAEVVGQRIECFHTERQMREEVKPALDVLLACGTDSREVHHRHSSGREFLMSMNTALVKDAEGQPIGMIAIGQDVTREREQQMEKERLLQELSVSHQDLTEFSYITSHNLRGPVTNLVSLCDLMGECVEPGSEGAELLAGLVQSTARLERTLEDLLRVLRIKRNPMPSGEPVELAPAMDTVRKFVGAEWGLDDVEVVTDFGAAPQVWFNELYLQSILQHLLINSLRYRSVERALRVEVTSTARDGVVELVFRDNGQGLDTERAGDRLFGLQRRYHAGSGGTGVGLYLVKSQLEAFGGSIRAKSWLGQGLQLTLRFPESKEAG